MSANPSTGTLNRPRYSRNPVGFGQTVAVCPVVGIFGRLSRRRPASDAAGESAAARKKEGTPEGP